MKNTTDTTANKAAFILLTNEPGNLWENHFEDPADAMDAFLKAVKAYGRRGRLTNDRHSYSVDLIKDATLDDDGFFDPDRPGYDVYTAVDYLTAYGDPDDDLDYFIYSDPWRLFRKDEQEIIAELADEGLPTGGSNYDLRMDDLRAWYREQYPKAGF